MSRTFGMLLFGVSSNLPHHLIAKSIERCEGILGLFGADLPALPPVNTEMLVHAAVHELDRG